MWLPFIFYGGYFSPVLLTIFATVLVLVDILSEWLETYRCNFDSQNSSMALHPCINSEEIHNLTSIRFMEYCDRPTQVIWCEQKHLHFLLLFIRTRGGTLKKVIFFLLFSLFSAHKFRWVRFKNNIFWFDAVVTERGDFLTRCVYALFELLFVHISVPFRGIYVD